MVDGKIERVLDAGQDVFVRLGFRRATMGDIAEEAGMSRPALYLVYPSKVEIFAAVLDRTLAASLAEIAAGLGRHATIDQRLRFAFEVWCVRPYEMVAASPDAADLFDSGRRFAPEVVAARFGAFERVVARILAAPVRAQTHVRLPAIQIARLTIAASLGFKVAANDAAHLRQLIAAQIAVVLAALR